MRVLVVEDESSISGFIRQGLSEAGFVVTVEADGRRGLQRAALGRVRRHHPRHHAARDERARGAAPGALRGSDDPRPPAHRAGRARRQGRRPGRRGGRLPDQALRLHGAAGAHAGPAPAPAACRPTTSCDWASSSSTGGGAWSASRIRRSISARGSSRCSSTCCVIPARCSRAPRSARRSGASTSSTTRTWWTCTSATCAASWPSAGAGPAIRTVRGVGYVLDTESTEWQRRRLPSGDHPAADAEPWTSAAASRPQDPAPAAHALVRRRARAQHRRHRRPLLRRPRDRPDGPGGQGHPGDGGDRGEDERRRLSAERPRADPGRGVERVDDPGAQRATAQVLGGAGAFRRPERRRQPRAGLATVPAPGGAAPWRVYTAGGDAPNGRARAGCRRGARWRRRRRLSPACAGSCCSGCRSCCCSPRSAACSSPGARSPPSTTWPPPPSRSPAATSAAAWVPRVRRSSAGWRPPSTACSSGWTQAFQRERRFVSDVSHELRTPLTALRGRIEVTLTRPRSRPEYEDTLRVLETEVARLTRLSEDLLLLARFDRGALTPRREQVDLSELLAAVRRPGPPARRRRGARCWWRTSSRTSACARTRTSSSGSS